MADEPEVIKKKVNSIATFPRQIDEPGIIKDNVLFIYLRAFVNDEHFLKFYPEYKNLKELEGAYALGGIGDGRVKKFLYEVLLSILSPIRLKRQELQNQIPYIIKVLREGTEKANKAANETLLEIKKAMGIDYFDNDNFEKEQIAKYAK